MIDTREDDPVYRGEDTILHKACGCPGAFMPAVAGNLFYFWCPNCRVWFVPARGTAISLTQEAPPCESFALEDFYKPLGVAPHERFYVVWKDRATGEWLFFPTATESEGFHSRAEAEEAARAAADNPRALSVFVLRCAQEVLRTIRGAGRLTAEEKP